MNISDAMKEFYLDNGCKVIQIANQETSIESIDQWLVNHHLISLSFHQSHSRDIENTLFLIYKNLNTNVLCIHLDEEDIQLKWLMNITDRLTIEKPNLVDVGLGCKIINQQAVDNIIKFNLKILENEPDLEARIVDGPDPYWICGRKMLSNGEELDMILIYAYLIITAPSKVETSYYLVRNMENNLFLIIKHHDRFR